MDRQRLEPARNAYHAFVTLPRRGQRWPTATSSTATRSTSHAPTGDGAGDALRILYLADIRFPLERANGIQTMETCYALAERGHDVHLIVQAGHRSRRRATRSSSMACRRTRRW